jgi:hypothetical protein
MRLAILLPFKCVFSDKLVLTVLQGDIAVTLLCHSFT